MIGSLSEWWRVMPSAATRAASDRTLNVGIRSIGEVHEVGHHRRVRRPGAAVGGRLRAPADQRTKDPISIYTQHAREYFRLLEPYPGELGRRPVDAPLIPVAIDQNCSGTVLLDRTRPRRGFEPTPARS